MYKRLLRKLRISKPPRLFLGHADVLPTTDIAAQFEFSPFSRPIDDTELRGYLREWLDLPNIPKLVAADSSDFVIDVYVSRYRLGQALWGSIGDLPIGILWRPKVEISCRLYSLGSHKVISNYVIRQHMSWIPFLRRTLSFRHWWSGAISSAEDIQILLGQALLRLMKQVRATL